MNNRIRRIGQVLHYSRVHAHQISNEYYAGNGYLRIWIDILGCYYKYGMWSNQFLLEKMYVLPANERKRIGEAYQQKNAQREEWLKQFIANRRFLKKYASFDYETSFARFDERKAAYREQYHAGKGLSVESGVLLTNQHYMMGNLVIKDNVLLGRDSDIDYTGDLTIGKGVSISEGVKILTHAHDLEAKFQNGGVRYDENDLYHGCVQTPLVIGDFAWIGAKAMIMPGTSEIGRGAVISANTVVSQRIPPYAIVQGYPAKIVGFRCNPEVVAEFERNNYPPEERIPIETLKANYSKYFNKERRMEIRQSMKL